LGWLADLPEEDLVVRAAGLVIPRRGRPHEPFPVPAEAREVFVAVAPSEVDQRLDPLPVARPPRDAGTAVSLMPLDPDQSLLARPPRDLTGVAWERGELSGREVVDAEGAEYRPTDGDRQTVIAQVRLLSPATERLSRVDQDFLVVVTELVAHDLGGARKHDGASVRREARVEAPLGEPALPAPIGVHDPNVPRLWVS